RPSSPGRLSGTRGPSERPWRGRCPGLAGPARVPRATGVRSGPPVVRCGYDSSLTTPGSLTGHGPDRCGDSLGIRPGMPGTSTAGLQATGSSLVGLAVRGAGAGEPLLVAAAAGVRRPTGTRGSGGPG